ncbi:4Fe-4S binding protein [Rhizobium sp. CB3090]|uniref:4Fe-4S binding protein n=1 Tax=Rhizobium sp. CB3090 TaxID=3039156 RepID=UPI0024B0ECBF|nr:4Fe-4S binding protein [Rhizobium sp. CB3090]WFU10338.1 4Fe-4S binding protein [Rhizobium sp. CB3090]
MSSRLSRIFADTFEGQPLFTKFAATLNTAACEDCGLCVSACPERAIRLQRASA